MINDNDADEIFDRLRSLVEAESTDGELLIANLEDNPQSAAIVHAIIGLGRSLKLPVIAEGVETVAQMSFLASEGCAEIQGFLIGRPQPIAHYQSVVSAPGGTAATVKLAS